MPENSGLTNNGTAVLMRLADVQTKPIQWLWPGRIAIGKLTLLVGDPGLGKSLVTIDLAARVSRGGGWPDAVGQGGDEPAAAGDVILLNAEDALTDTVRPRLEAAGADLDRIVALTAVRREVSAEKARSWAKHRGQRERAFSIYDDLDALEAALVALNSKQGGQAPVAHQTAQTRGQAPFAPRPSIDGAPPQNEPVPEEPVPERRCRLVIIDPISAYLGQADSNSNTEVRAVLHPLAEIAERHGVAVVAVSHLNKKGRGRAMYRAMGSLAFVAAARAVWAMLRDPEDDERRLLLPVKTNLAAGVTGLAFRIEAAHERSAPHVVWSDDIIDDPIDVFLPDEQKPEQREQAGKLNFVAEWLAEQLSDGPQEVRHLELMSIGTGFSQYQLFRAAKRLGVQKRKLDFYGGWEWRLPAGPRAESGDQVSSENETHDARFIEFGQVPSEVAKHGGRLGTANALIDEAKAFVNGMRSSDPAVRKRTLKARHAKLDAEEQQAMP